MDSSSRAANAKEWAAMFQPDAEGRGDHQRDGERCRKCKGHWPCATITEPPWAKT